jgi:hypothetical protein
MSAVRSRSPVTPSNNFAVSVSGAHGLGRIPRAWVPAEHRDLHEFLVDRRNQHAAHTDGTAPHEHRLQVSEDDGWVMIGFPDSLTPSQLVELAELAEKLREIVATELERARTVLSPVPPSTEK